MKDVVLVKSLYRNTSEYSDKKVKISGWIRTLRASNAFGFIEVNDGSFFKNVQVVFDSAKISNYKEISKLPNREGMYSMLLGMLQAPVSKFARVVKAVAEAKPEDGSAAAEEAAPVEEAAPEAPVVEETAEETKEETAE